jgi:cobalt-zinc-cadmium efflux system outer membrane protein
MRDMRRGMNGTRPLTMDTPPVTRGTRRKPNPASRRNRTTSNRRTGAATTRVITITSSSGREITMSTEARVAALAQILLAASCASSAPRTNSAHVAQLSRAALTESPSRGDDRAAAEEIHDLLGRPLTADSAVRVAILNNRELRAATHEIAATRGRARQDGALPNPSFQFDLRRPVAREKDFLVEYDLTHALLAPLRSAPGEAEVEAEQLRAAGAAVELGYRVRTAFFAHQAEQQRLAVANRMLDALAAGRDAARALFRAGNVRELDVVAQEAAYEGARASTAEIELEMLERREALQRLLGLHGGATAWTSSPELPAPEKPPGTEDVEAQAVKASLELAELKRRLDAIARRTRLARAEGWIPDVKIDAHAEQDDGRWETGGGATIAIPLFDRRQGALAAHEAEFDAARERYEGTAVEIRSAAREARDRLDSAFRRARQYRDVVVPARRRVVEHALLQFNAMQVSVFELLQFQRELLQAELAAADALRDYWTARAQFDALAGGARGADTATPRARASFPSTTVEGGH